MKKFLLSIICTLFPMLSWAQEPYAILIDNGTALEFHYDSNKSAFSDAMDIGPFTEPIQRGWDSSAEGIYSVVFNESFANCSTITSTAYWFAGFRNLETLIGLKYLNTSSVTDIDGMFLECRSLTSLDLSSFNTLNATNMSLMFAGCNALTTITVSSGWATDNVVESSGMFEGCVSLVGGNGTQYSQEHMDASYAHIDTENYPGYFTASSSGEEPNWQELNYMLEYGADVLSRAKESGNVDQWMLEELEMFLNQGHEMYKEHTASAEEVRAMTEDLEWRIREVEEAMKGGGEGGEASEEAWAELHDAVERGDSLLTEAREAGTVEPWALEELENMTVKGSLMYEEHQAGEEEVRHTTEELNHIIWEVEEMMHHEPQGEAYFYDNTAYVYGNATLDDAFAEVGRETAIQTIAAIVWEGNEALTDDMLSGINNPNLLVFVNEASKAPAGVQNVVINGVAEEIKLIDAPGNNNFYSPQSFTAQRISYSHNFSQTTEIEVSRGWETIALPFDVQSITHESHGALVPFGGEGNGYQFWLRQLTENGLARATQIEANKPYLISMPNNIIYPSEYNQNGVVTFSATNVTVPETIAQSDSYGNVTLSATFKQVEQGGSIYALNVGETRGEYPEGSVFEQNYRDIRPFQAYTTHAAGTRFITLGSLGGDDGSTGIKELRIENPELGDSNGYWYSLDGQRLDVKPTRKGVYVKDGRKIVIK